MIGWILAVLALFVAQTLLPPSLRYLLAGRGTVERVRVALGPRDEPPPMPRLGARAERALHNLQEALPVFLTVALLLMVEGEPAALATRGAALFFVARVLYVPAYLSGVPGLRSAIWVVSWIGLAGMTGSLLATGR